VACGITFAWPSRRWIWTFANGISLAGNVLLALLILFMSIVGGSGGVRNAELWFIGAFIAEIMSWIYLGLMVSIWIALKARPGAFPIVPNSG
jgi:hypothetical protein